MDIYFCFIYLSFPLPPIALSNNAGSPSSIFTSYENEGGSLKWMKWNQSRLICFFLSTLFYYFFGTLKEGNDLFFSWNGMHLSFEARNRSSSNSFSFSSSSEETSLYRGWPILWNEMFQRQKLMAATEKKEDFLWGRNACLEIDFAMPSKMAKNAFFLFRVFIEKKRKIKVNRRVEDQKIKFILWIIHFLLHPQSVNKLYETVIK